MSLKTPKKPNVDRDIQKRTFSIQPTKVDKKLVQELGEFLENQEDRTLLLTYTLDSKTKEVTKEKVEDFVNSDWGQDMRKITINSKTAVRIKMDFSEPELSEYTVYGRNPTWVNGTTKCIGEIFQKYKLRYAPIKTNALLKASLVIFLDVLLCYPIFLALPFFSLSGTIVVIPFLLFPILLYSFVNWIFPYFEYGEPLQKSMRKWIWLALISSGIIPSIILKLLGF
jgi:hypothetical protein